MISRELREMEEEGENVDGGQNDADEQEEEVEDENADKTIVCYK